MEVAIDARIDASERRRYRRLVSDFDVDLILFSGPRAGDQITGKVVNISKEGAGVLLHSEILIGTQVALTVFSDDDQSVGSGEILWKREGLDGVMCGLKISQWSYLDPSIERKLIQKISPQ